jgi:hypothetical protein
MDLWMGRNRNRNRNIGIGWKLKRSSSYEDAFYL